ncbi:MAG: hypothetical protein ACOX6U_09190 [Oscillospiraceae bacterium]
MKLSDVLSNVRFGTKIAICRTNRIKIIEFECLSGVSGKKFPLDKAYLGSEISCIYTDGETLCIELYDSWED